MILTDKGSSVRDVWINLYNKHRDEFLKSAQIVMLNPLNDYFQRTFMDWFRFPVTTKYAWPWKSQGAEQRLSDTTPTGSYASFMGMLYSDDVNVVNRMSTRDLSNPNGGYRFHNMFMEVPEVYMHHFGKIVDCITDLHNRFLNTVSDSEVVETQLDVKWNEWFNCRRPQPGVKIYDVSFITI